MRARKPKEAKAKPPERANPKANLKKTSLAHPGAAPPGVHQKPLPWSQSPSKTKGTQNTPKICNFTTKGEGGFEAAIEEGKKGRG